MARKYSEAASDNVRRVMKKRKKGTLKSGRSKKKVTSRKQAIAIALSEARRAGKKVPKKAARKSATEKAAKKTTTKTATKKTAARKKTATKKKTAKRATKKRATQKRSTKR